VLYSAFAAGDIPGPLQRGFSAIRAAFPDADGTRAEVAWSMLHGQATLQASGRLRAGQAQARWDAVIDARVALQAVALAALCVGLAAA
jgi:hypothetical protein